MKNGTNVLAYNVEETEAYRVRHLAHSQYLFFSQVSYSFTSVTIPVPKVKTDAKRSFVDLCFSYSNVDYSATSFTLSGCYIFVRAFIPDRLLFTRTSSTVQNRSVS